MKQLTLHAALAACFALPQLPAQANNWNITDIGTLGGSFSQALDINDAGQVVGAAASSSGSTRAFLYSGGSMADLGTLGGSSATAYGINNLGQIVGGSSTANATSHAFLYNNGGMSDLGVLGGDTSTAYAINDHGAVVGQSSLRPFNPQAPDPNTYAFMYQNGSMTQLSNNFSSARSINAGGEATGYSFVSGTIPPRPNGAAFGNGNVALLGTLEGPSPNPASPSASSSATAINNAGQIVGSSSVDGGKFTHAFLYANGSMTDLGTLPGMSNSVAVDINNHGQIIGTSDGFSPNGASITRSFLYENGHMTDLGSLPEIAAAGWKIETVTAINNLGQITGYGTYNGQTRGFILSGLTAPEIDGGNAALALGVLAGLLALRKKKPDAG